MKPISSSNPKNALHRFQVLESVLKQIGAEQSRIILMHSRGYKVEDIAKALNMSKNLADDQLVLAKKKIRDLLNKHYKQL